MKLSGMSNGEIVHELKKDFSSLELEKVANEIDRFVTESITLDELKTKINNHLYFEIYS